MVQKVTLDGANQLGHHSCPTPYLYRREGSRAGRFGTARPALEKTEQPKDQEIEPCETLDAAHFLNATSRFILRKLRQRQFD